MTSILDDLPAMTPDDGGSESGIVPDPFEGLPVLVAVPRAAEILGISRSAAYRLASDGVLPTRRLGGRVYILTSGLRAIVA